MKKFLEIIKNKWLIKGTTTVLLVVIVIACYILLNWGVEKINLEDLDCTEQKIYSLSDTTKDKIKSLEKEVTIQLINLDENYYYDVIECAKKYTKISDKIKMETISDLSTRTDLKEKYNLGDTDGILVVKNENKEKTLSINDLYTYDYSSGNEINRAEEAITNAIVEINLEEKPEIYILTGNSRNELQQSLANIINTLEEEANEVNYLDILVTGNVPEDCDCLIITTLTQDLSELERDKIIEYIQNGGKLLLLTSQSSVEIETPNFDAVLAEYGISLGYGVLFEQDSSKMLSQSPTFIVTEASASFMRDIGMTLKMCVVEPGKIEFESEEKLEELGVEYETIVSTSEEAFLRTNFEIQSYSRTEQDSEEGTAIIGALVTKTISDDKESELIIYSSETFASNLPVQVYNQYFYAVSLYNNEDVILNSISHLTERKDTITIRKTSETENYSVTDQEDAIIKTIIFVLPVLIIGIGIVVWQVRRRK